MRTLTTLAAVALLSSGCSEYDLTAPPLEEPGVIEDTEPPNPVDSSTGLTAPIAVCSSNPDTVRPPFESNSFIGSASNDPEGQAITEYRWTIAAQPTGSGATLGGSGSDRSFTADQAGIYTAQLIVVTEDNRVSDPCTVDLNAIPAEALWIEMFWEHAEDIDLHLLAPGGTYDSLTTDCYFMNCTSAAALEWGAAGAADNPSLDLDDTSGTGPENINIAAPQFGTFTVAVHDHPFTSYAGANDVTINIYVDGLLEWTGTKSFSGEDDVQNYAEIDWPTAQIRGL